MHYDWYGIFQGGMLPLSPDSEDEQYSCEKYSCVCYITHISAPNKLILHSMALTFVPHITTAVSRSRKQPHLQASGQFGQT